MIEAIWSLGRYVNSKEKKDEIETRIDRAKLARTKKILCIILSEILSEESKTIQYQYKGVFIEDYSSKKPILYRPGSPNGLDILPCAIITDPSKTFKKKIMAWFKKYRDDDTIRKYLDGRVSSIDKVLNEKKEIIEGKLKAAYDSLRVDKKSGTNVLLTIKFDKNGKERHLGEDPSFRNAFLALSKERCYSYETGESRGKGTCHLCGQEKELGGYALSSMGFKFATADKPGFTPNLCKADYWKAIQICDDCAEIIESGKKFIDENLDFPKEDNFLGCRYYVIPKFLFRRMFDERMFDELYDRILFYKDKNYDEGLLTKEDWIEKEFAKKDDVLRLIFLFYEKDRSRFLIHGYVEDVVPSWLKQIDESQRKIRTMPIFQEDAIKKMFGKDGVGDFVTWRSGNDQGLGRKGNNWYAVFLRAFFKPKSAGGNFDNEFRSIIGAILSNKRISRDLIINSFMREIRGDIRKQEIHGFQVLCIKSFMLYLFLNELGLIGVNYSGGYEKMDEEKGKEDFSKSFFERVEGFFNEYGIREEDKRAAFCVGMLADCVLYVQRRTREIARGDEPFWGKLHGLMLDERRIKNIFRDSITKLRQYKKPYPDLEEAAGRCLVAAEGKWNSTKDELSYFFALGMTLSKVLGYKIDEKKETETEGGN